MKNRLIRERYSALTVLSQRVLPSKTAINKVTALIATRFQQPYQATEAGRKKVIEDHPTPPEWDKDHLPPAIAEARQSAIDLFLEERTPVRKIPDTLRLTDADLPRALKRENGDANVEGLAQIIVMLGSLYVPGADELALRAGVDGEEPDEPAPALPDDDFAPAAAE
jgi:hypothetical protein